MAEFGGQSQCRQTESKSKEWCNQLWQSLEEVNKTERKLVPQCTSALE